MASRDVPRPSIIEVWESYEGIVHNRTGPDGWQRATCVLHPPDTSASAMVNEDHGRFRCYHENVSGDQLDLIGRMEGVGFGKACKVARERFETRESDNESEQDGSLAPRRTGRRPGRRNWTPPWAM